MKKKKPPLSQSGDERSQQFLREVFPAELNEIKRRRTALFGTPPSDWPAAKSPSTKLGLMGLAFSGGGIRSATFNLGILQVLAQADILKHVDYLSTVSGGGYIGACLSSLLNRPSAGPEAEAFPFRHIPGIEEPKAFKHLRNHSNYLASGGILDVLRIPALLLRGVLINLLVVLPVVILAVGLTDFFYGESFGAALVTGKNFEWISFYQLTPWIAAATLLWIVLFPLIQRLFQNRIEEKFTLRNKYELSFVGGLLAVVAAMLLESLPPIFFYYAKWARAGSAGRWTAISLVVALIPYLFADKAAARVSKWNGMLALYGMGLLGPLMIFLLYLGLGNWIIMHLVSPAKLFIYAGAVLLFLYTQMSVDVNLTSLHHFYRDRLSKAYLFQVDEKGDILPNDKQKLSQLNAEGTKAPYHLINVALNLQNSDDPELRGRACDFFIFSKHFVGSVRTGFCPTATMETFDRHLGLGTAMAISGAAAAPNMGTSTIKSLVFILALLNIRLGYWLPNPFVQRKPWYLRGPLLGVGPLFLMKEFFSKIDEKSRYVNLSDGGHIENLGVYELLRRRCKFIIACDGEADPDLRFASLVKLIRFARIDMGIDIEINLADLRKQQTRLSSQHGAMGKIHYSKDETGYLLYIKASITGDENVYIRDYQQRHPLFPHESTADQFFDEAQFEVYRALGHHVVKKLNIDIIKTQTRKGQRNGDEIEQLFATLETQLQPRTSPP